MPRLLRYSALVFLVASQVRAQSVDGWTLTVRSMVDSGSIHSKHWYTSRMRIAGQFVRTESMKELVETMPLGTDLPALISDDSAQTTTFIYDKGRRASIMPRANLTGVQGLQANDPASRFIVAPTISMHDLGAGEPIVGHPTHKYSYALSYVAQTTFMGSPCKRTVNTVETIWAATDMPPEEHLRRYVHDSPPTGTISLGPVADSLDRLRIHRERLVHGQILKTSSSLAKVRADGTPITVKTTTEVTELSHGPLARSLFTVPADYTTMTQPARTSADSPTNKAAKAKIDSMVNARVRPGVCDL